MSLRVYSYGNIQACVSCNTYILLIEVIICAGVIELVVVVVVYNVFI